MSQKVFCVNDADNKLHLIKGTTIERKGDGRLAVYEGDKLVAEFFNAKSWYEKTAWQIS